jgi:uncharacterized protein YidB (DUF937 family)
MDFNQLLQLGAEMIRNNSDEATTDLDSGAIMEALSGVLGGDGEGVDLAGLVQRFAGGDLGEAVQSWLGEGENAPIEPEQVEAALGEERVSLFAERLGISRESARQALADALPEVVDKATPPGSDMLSGLLEQVGGVEGALGMLGKMFGRG